MDLIDSELLSRFRFSVATEVQGANPSNVFASNPPHIARWIAWSRGAAGLLHQDPNYADKWLRLFLDFSSGTIDAGGDPLLRAEVFSAFSELSLITGEYFDAIRRSQVACALWETITKRIDNLRQHHGSGSAYNAGVAEYIDGDVSRHLQMDDKLVFLGNKTVEMIMNRAVVKFLGATTTAIRAHEFTHTYSPELEVIITEFLEKHAGRIPSTLRYKQYVSLGNLAVVAGAIEASVDWFDKAISIYYQAVQDYSDLYRLVQAMFNKANSLGDLEQYDEALNIYSMISGEFSRVGDYEAELRVDYAIAYTKYRKGEMEGLEDKLRKIIEDYHELIKEAEMYHKQLDVRNLHIANLLLLDVIASKPSSVERFLEGLLLSSRVSLEPSINITNRFRDLQEGRSIHWRDITSVELLLALLENVENTMFLSISAGAQSSVIFALFSGKGDLPERCHISRLSADFASASRSLVAAVQEENERIIEHRQSERTIRFETIHKIGREVWNHLPAKVRQMINSSGQLYLVLSPVDYIGDLPVDLIMTDRGWLGLTHSICRAYSVSELVSSLSSNGVPKRFTKSALVLYADDPDNMISLNHTFQESLSVIEYARLLGLEARAPVTLDPVETINELKIGHHLFHYVGHGSADRLGERLLLSGNRWLPRGWLQQIDIHKAPIAFFSACEVGRARYAGETTKSFVVEMLAIGSPGVVASVRPISDRVSGEIVREIYSASSGGATLPVAIRDARRELDKEGINPVCWSVYAFYGNPSVTLKVEVAQESNLKWHEHLMFFLATGNEVYRQTAIQALNAEESNFGDIVRLRDIFESNKLHRINEIETLISSLARHDLLGALRLRAFTSAYRVEHGLKKKTLDQDTLLEEIGTGLTIALRIHDAYAFVGLAQHHYDLLGIVTIDEVVRVLGHAAQLSKAMALHNENFIPVSKRFAERMSQFEGKSVIDLTKIIPPNMLD